MRKVLAIILATLCLLGLTACRQGQTQPSIHSGTTVTFKAKILEIHDSTYLVEPMPDTQEAKSADKISVNKVGDLDVKVGDYIAITYDGLIMESYPAQIIASKIATYVHAGTPVQPAIPALVDVPKLSAEDLTDIMTGRTQDEVHAAWGSPHGVFSGFYGDIYYTDETKTMHVCIYYNYATKQIKHILCTEVDTRRSMFQYKYEGEGCGGDFIITLYSDGTFQYYEGTLSSYIGMGTWTIDENNITCLKDNVMHKSDGSEFIRTNYFYSIGNEMRWIAEGSDNFLYVTVKDGEKFISVYSGKEPNAPSLSS